MHTSCSTSRIGELHVVLLGQMEASALKDDLILVVSTFAELHVSTMKNDACVNSEIWFYCNSVSSER